MKSVKSIILISSSVIVGIALLTISSRSQEITTKPMATTQADEIQEKFTRLAVPGAEDGLIFLLPKELPPLKWLSNSDNKGRSPFYSAAIELNGAQYAETSLRIQQKPDEEYSPNVPISIQFFSFSPKLSPDLYYRNEDCEPSETIIQEDIGNIAVTLIKQKCSDTSMQFSYGYWFDRGPQTIGFRAVVDESTEQPQYLKELLATFIAFNQKQ